MEERTTIIDEILTPTFIALAASVAAATVIVILLIALICHRFCPDFDYDDAHDHDHDYLFRPQYVSFQGTPNDYDHADVHDDDHDYGHDDGIDDDHDDGHDADHDYGRTLFNLHPYQALPTEARLHHRQSAGVSFNRSCSS